MKRSSWQLVMLCILFVSISLAYVFFVDRDHWFDESFTLRTTEILREQGNINFQEFDVHPPASYLLATGWMLIPHSIVDHMWLRLLSVVGGLLFVIFVWLFAQEVFEDKSSAKVAVALLAVGTTVIYYAAEARMYVWVMALSAFAMYACVRAMRERVEGTTISGYGWWLSGVAAMCALPFFQYFSVVAILVILGVVAVEMYRRGLPKKYIAMNVGLAAIVAGVFAATSAVVFAFPQLSRIGRMFLVEPSPIWSLVSAYAYAFQRVGSEIENPLMILTAIVVVIAVLIYAAILMRRLGNDKWTAVVLFSAVGIVAIGMSLTKVIAYHHRYFLVIMWMFVLATYYVLLSKSKMRVTVVSVLLVVSVVSLFILFRSALPEYRYTTYDTEFQAIMRQVPCHENVTLVHEVTFSYVPAMVYTKEHACDIQNVFVTDFESFREGVGAGFDLLRLKGEKIWYKGEFDVQNKTFLYINIYDSLGINESEQYCVLWTNEHAERMGTLGGYGGECDGKA